MTFDNTRSSSGIAQLDHLLNGGLFVGDNVVWYDTAGSLAALFCHNFIQTSKNQKRPLIYVSFDRSPRNLLERLGPLADTSRLTILDCFTYGKGAGADIFLNFYQKSDANRPCRVICVKEPRKMDTVMDAFYGIHDTLEGVVHFVFESLTGMQELWEGEDHLISFYSHSCPRLYELNTIAYWIIEKEAHSARLKAQINQIAQVAVDLSIKRGKTALTILKAEKRDPQAQNRPFFYWSKNLNVFFDSESGQRSKIDVGTRLKNLRAKRGLSQTDLGKRVGVTPSTISQVENNLIYPSLPALFKMAEVLSIEPGLFLQESTTAENPIIFRAADAAALNRPDLPSGSVSVKLLTPIGLDAALEVYLIEIPPGKKINAHFFSQKGEEMGYLLSGRLKFKIEAMPHKLDNGDLIYLTADIPSQWRNQGTSTARLLWLISRR